MTEDYREANVNFYLQKGQEGGSRELQVGQPGLNPQENHGKTKRFCVHEGQNGSWGYPAWIHNGEIMFDQPEGEGAKSCFQCCLVAGPEAMGKKGNTGVSL